MPKNTTQCPWPGLEPGVLALESSALTMRPPRLPPISQRRGVISLIPKDENNLTTLSNWRPITLLNVDYKILAKVIAKRIEPVLLKSIMTKQGLLREDLLDKISDF